MQNGTLCKVTELPAEARHLVEALLGRSLQEDEAISINVYQPVPTGQAREEASRRLFQRIDQTAARAQGVPDDEIEAAIDEAADYVRRHRE